MPDVGVGWQTVIALILVGFCIGWIGMRLVKPFRRLRQDTDGENSGNLIQIDPPNRN